MHRAAAGETFHITRRGKPFCRLTPPESLFEDAGGEITGADPCPQHD
jgi:antitoxin (DNA-binding transcriptional repressor) of toxin-antitoxin stability system